MLINLYRFTCLHFQKGSMQVPAVRTALFLGLFLLGLLGRTESFGQCFTCDNIINVNGASASGNVSAGCVPSPAGANFGCQGYRFNASTTPALIPGATIYYTSGNGGSCSTGGMSSVFVEINGDCSPPPAGTGEVSTSGTFTSSFVIPLNATEIVIYVCRSTGGGNPNLCSIALCGVNLANTTATAPSCIGANDGSITAVGALQGNVVGTLTYSINGVGGSTANTTGIFNNLAPGVYTVSAYDSGNTSCVGTAQITVPAAATPCCTPSSSCKSLPTVNATGCTIPAALSNVNDVFNFQACGATVTMGSSDIGDVDICGDGNGANFTRVYTLRFNGTPVRTCLQSITVNPTAPVFANCGQTIAIPGCNPTILPDCSNITSTAFGGAVTASNQCGTVPVSCAAGPVTNAGGCNRSQVFTFTAVGCGITSTCTRTFTWQETTAPVFSNCGNFINLGCNPTNLPSCANINQVAFGGPILASNQCGAVNVDCSAGPVINLSSCSRQQTFTFTATACGLTSTCIRTFQWTQPVSPTTTNCGQVYNLGCNPSVLPTCSNVSLAAFGGAISTSTACGPVNVSCAVTANTSNGCNRQRVITFTITACGLSTTCTRTYNWTSDFTKPTFVAPPTLNLQCTDPVPPVVNPVATDGCGGPVTVMYLGEVCNYLNCSVNRQLVRTWKATDQCGNTTLTTQAINISDTQAPTFTQVPPPVTIECSDIFPAVPALPTATDACCSYVQVVYNGQTTALGNCPQNYVVTRQWTAIDECGNARTATQTITVRDTRKPNFVNPPANITIDCDEPGLIPEPPVIMVMDNCDTYVPVVYLGQTATTPGPDCSYVITRNWTATDDCGNQQAHQQTISLRAPLRAPSGTDDRETKQNEQQTAEHWQLKTLLSPNPAKEEVWVTFNAPAENKATLSLLDAGGRLVLQQSVTALTGMNQFKMDLAKAAGGFYTIQVKIGDQRSVERLIVVK